MRRLPLLVACSFVIFLFVTGCGHKVKRSSAPPPPARRAPAPSRSSAPPAVDSEEDARFVSAHHPIYSEQGYASWYGGIYHNRRAANGQTYDENALTAAHRMLPLNSLIKVTNLQSGQSAIMRITDRGPFVTDRIIDLSAASAKAVGVWRPGTALVRIDVYEAPHSITDGGRWCVQIGAFSSEHESLKLRDHLQRKYRAAQVIEFTGPTGHWVRIRPENDNKEKAVELSREIRPEEGHAYLVRLD